MPTHEEIFEKVRQVVMEALAVDADQVRPEATLVGDLGAESIDMLDIAFRLEKAFGIKIPRGELFPEDIFTNQEFVQDGKLTPAGLEELRKRMPYRNFEEFAMNPVVQDFANFLTVEDICTFVERKVATAQPAGVPEAGSG
jgi:acyl carrier protein